MQGIYSQRIYRLTHNRFIVNRFLPMVKNHRTFFIAVFFAVLLGLITVAVWHAPPYQRYGDSTYFLQIISLAEDHDIRYTAIDLNRIAVLGYDDLPAGMELIKTTGGEYYFAKEFTYALAAAPFYSAGGYHGVLVLNGLLLFLMMGMGYLFLRGRNDVPVSMGVSVLFFTLSTAIVYIFWIHLEIYAMFVLMAALFLAYSAYHRQDVRLFCLAGVLFGLATVVRPWHIFFFIPFIAYELHHRQWKRSAFFSLSFLAAVLVIILPFFALTGTTTFYGGDRFYYPASPYPFEPAFDLNTTDRHLTTFRNTLQTLKYSGIPEGYVVPVITGFFTGRFTGIFWYYPLTLFVIAALLFSAVSYRKESHYRFTTEWKLLVLTGIITSILFIFIIRGWGNYFGGSGSVGNRYFTIYPAFLFLLGKIDPRKFAVFSVVAMIIIAPVVLHPIETSKNPVTVATSFPFTHFPVEYPALFSLPIGYDNRYAFPPFTEMKLTGEDVNATNYFFIRDRTELIFFSNRPIGNLSFVVYAEIPGNIHASMKGMASSRTLEPRSAQIVTFDSLIPEYRSRNYHVYSLVVHPDIPVIMVPFSMNGEIIEHSYFTGWYPPEDWEGSGIQTRWMDREASVITIWNESRPGVISFQLASFYQPRNVLIFEQETLTTEAQVEPFFSTFHVPSEGFISILRFSVPGGGERPAGIPDLENPDTRNLSVAIRNITIERIDMIP